MDRSEILEASEELFSSKNIYFTLAELSQKLSIKPPSLYNHFKSKDEIIKFTIFREIDCLYAYVERLFEDLTEDTLEIWLDNYLNQLLVYFNTVQKAKFWRQLSLIDPDYKEQFSIYQMNAEKTMIKKLSETFVFFDFESFLEQLQERVKI